MNDQSVAVSAVAGLVVSLDPSSVNRVKVETLNGAHRFDSSVDFLKRRHRIVNAIDEPYALIMKSNLY